MLVVEIDRKLGIGGGDIAAILGLSKFKTAIDVWEVKTGRKSGNIDYNFRIRKAFALEKTMIDEYLTLKDVFKSPYAILPEASIVDSKEPIFQGHLDGLLLKDDKPHKILECKYVRYSMRSSWGEDGSTDIPTEYLLQAAWYASILHVDVDLPVLFGDDDTIHVFHYQRDLELEKAIREHARRFWHDFVVPDKMPLPQTADDLSRYYPQSNKDIKPVGLDAYEIAKSLKLVNTELKTLQQEKEVYEQKLKEEIAEGNGISFGGVTVATWTTYDTQKFDRARFKEEHPDLFEHYCSTEKQRRFYLKMEHSDGS